MLELAVCWDSGAGETASYVTYNLPTQEELDYGVIDCLAYGFPYVRSRFEKSIIPLIVDDEIGSAFLVEGNKILTARHCLAGSPGPIASVKLIGIEPQCVRRIVRPKDPNRDVGVFMLDSDLKFGATPLRMGTAALLAVTPPFVKNCTLSVGCWHRMASWN